MIIIRGAGATGAAGAAAPAAQVVRGQYGGKRLRLLSLGTNKTMF